MSAGDRDGPSLLEAIVILGAFIAALAWNGYTAWEKHQMNRAIIEMAEKAKP